MLRKNKFIIGLLIIGTTVVNPITSLKASAYSALTNAGGAYRVEIDYDNIYKADINGDTWSYTELSDGTLLVLGVKDPKSYVEVPAYINNKPVTFLSRIYPGDRQNIVQANIKSVKIPSTVKAIGDWAFSFCTNITDIQLPASVTNIASTAFANTPWFENQIKSQQFLIINNILLYASKQSGNVIIPSGVKEIGANVFANQTDITSVEFPDSVTEIGEHSFSGCTKLKKIKVSNPKAYLRQYAFSDCTILKNVTPPARDRIESNVFLNTPYQKVQDEADALRISSMSTESASQNTQSSVTITQGWHRNNGKWEWLWSNGTNRYGWYNENGEWYYFYGNGQMATEFIDLGNSYSYYLKPDPIDGKASMVTGWQYINGDWFYFNPCSDGYKGAMKRACWEYINGKWYYFYYSGKMAHDTYIDGYYVNSSGAWVK